MGLLDSLTSGLGHITQSAGTSADTALHQKVHEAYVKMQAQKDMQAQQGYATSGTISAINPYLAQNGINPYLNQIPTPIEIATVKLDEGAWDVPISQLVDLWTVRFGSKWVKDEELDEFYRITTQRLRPLNKIESHYVNGHDVFRIVE